MVIYISLNKARIFISCIFVLAEVSGCTPPTKLSKNATSIMSLPAAKNAKATRQVEVRDVEFSPDNSRFVVAKRGDVGNKSGGEIEMWDARAKRQILRWGTSQVPRTALFLDANRLAIHGSDLLQIWDVRTAKLLKTRALSGRVLTVNTRRNLVATEKEIWRVHDWKKRATIRSQMTDFIRAAAFSPDETVLVTAAWDDFRGIEGFNTKTGRRLWKADGDQQGNVAFSPDGRSVGVSTTKGIVLLNPKTGRKIRQFGNSYGGDFHFLSDQILVQENVNRSKNHKKSRVTYAVSTGKILKTMPAFNEEFVAPDESLRFRFVGAEKRVQFE